MINWPIRPAEASDKNYILKTWLKWVRAQDPYHQMSPRAFDKYSAKVHGVVGACPTHICHDTQDKGLIYGFITFDPIIRCVHMCNVRKDFRRHRIGTELVVSAFGSTKELRCSHYTKTLDALKWDFVEYDPYLLEGEL